MMQGSWPLFHNMACVGARPTVIKNPTVIVLVDSGAALTCGLPAPVVTLVDP